MLAPYRELLRSSAGRLLGLSAGARLSFGIGVLALTIHVEEAAGSYAAAGLAVGVFGGTAAVLAPLRGRLIDRHGRAPLAVLAATHAALLAAIALTPAAGPDALSYILLAGLAGAFAPPFTAWTRAALATRLDGHDLQLAYTVDNISEESVFVLGPLAAAAIVAIASAGAALVCAGALALAGGLALAVAGREGGWRPPRRDRTPGRRAAPNRPLAIAIATLAGVGAALGLIEVAILAFAQGEGSTAATGVILAALSAGGVVGALGYGLRTWTAPTSRLYALMLGLLGVGMAALTLPSSIPAMAGVIAVAGLALTPCFLLNSLLIEQLSPGGPSTTAFAAVTTATNGGAAVGAALSGAIVDGPGIDAAFLAATAGLALAALVALSLPGQQEPARRG